MPKVIVVDIEKCMGCKSCELQCAVAHSASKELTSAIQESPRPRHRVTVIAVGEMAVPLQCRHCEDAPCVAICPTGALQKPNPEGPVTIDQDLCIGCKSCLLVCPFGVISLGPEGKSLIKCDMCMERLEAGQPPACVEACPTGALQLKDVEELTAEVRRQAAGELVISFRQAALATSPENTPNR